MSYLRYRHVGLGLIRPSEVVIRELCDIGVSAPGYYDFKGKLGFSRILDGIWSKFMKNRADMGKSRRRMFYLGSMPFNP